jgi:hypothetical protein
MFSLMARIAYSLSAIPVDMAFSRTNQDQRIQIHVLVNCLRDNSMTQARYAARLG